MASSTGLFRVTVAIGLILIPGTFAIACLRVYAATNGWIRFGPSAEAAIVHSNGPLFLPFIFLYLLSFPWVLFALSGLWANMDWRRVSLVMVSAANFLLILIANIPGDVFRSMAANFGL